MARKKNSYASKLKKQLGEIELIDEDNDTDAQTGEFVPKGALLFRQIDRINRIQCMQPIDIDLFASSVEALHIMLYSDTEMNPQFRGDYEKLNTNLQGLFKKVPDIQKQTLYKNYKLYYIKELLKLLVVMMHNRGYYRTEFLM